MTNKQTAAWLTSGGMHALLLAVLAWGELRFLQPEMAIQSGGIRLQAVVVDAAEAEGEDSHWHVHVPKLSQDHRHAKAENELLIHRHSVEPPVHTDIQPAPVVVAQATLSASLPIVQLRVEVATPIEPAIPPRSTATTDEHPVVESQPPRRSRTVRPSDRPPIDVQAEIAAVAPVTRANAGATVDELPRKLPGNLAPPYPPAAYAQRQTGRVLLAVLVSLDGTVAAIRLADSSGVESLDRAASAAVQRWRFAPARRGGKAVAQEVIVPIRFSLRGVD